MPTSDEPTSLSPLCAPHDLDLKQGQSIAAHIWQDSLRTGRGIYESLLPDAPLLTDDYGATRLRANFAGFLRPTEILDNERRLSGELINIERLLG